METINSIAGAASKAIWGESPETNREPVSGKLGDTEAGEPYDAGNLDSTTTETAAAPKTTTSIGPIVDAREASSKTVDTTRNSKEPGPVSATAAAGSGTYLSYRPSAAATTEPTETSTSRGDAEAASTAGGTTSVGDGKMPKVGDKPQSLGESHAIGIAGEEAPALKEVKSLHGGLSANRGTEQAQKIKEAEKETAGAPAEGIGGGDSAAKKTTVGGTGKGTGIGTSSGATKSAGGAEGGAAEGEEHRGGSKLGAFKEKIKAKLHHKSDKP